MHIGKIAVIWKFVKFKVIYLISSNELPSVVDKAKICRHPNSIMIKKDACDLVSQVVDRLPGNTIWILSDMEKKKWRTSIKVEQEEAGSYWNDSNEKSRNKYTQIGDILVKTRTYRFLNELLAVPIRNLKISLNSQRKRTEK